jgi:hypothetical protein
MFFELFPALAWKGHNEDWIVEVGGEILEAFSSAFKPFHVSSGQIVGNTGHWGKMTPLVLMIHQRF